MKRSVENAEHVGLLTPTAGQYLAFLYSFQHSFPTACQYFQDEQRRRHSQYDGGTRLADKQKAAGKHSDATASSFQPLGQSCKGKNALVFYPKGSPTVAGALSQDTDIYVDQAQVMLRDKLTLNLRLAFLNIFPDTLGDWPPQEGRLVKSQRGSEHSTTLLTSTSSLRDVMSEQPSGCGVMVAARRSVYGAEILPRTTDFGVTPGEARELHQKQQAYDAGKETAAQDAAAQNGGGIWDGTQTNNKHLLVLSRTKTSFHRSRSEKLSQLLKDCDCRNCEKQGHYRTREANISSALNPSLGQTRLIVTSNCLALVIAVNKPLECPTEDQRRTNGGASISSALYPSLDQVNLSEINSNFILSPHSPLRLQTASIHSLPPISKTSHAALTTIDPSTANSAPTSTYFNSGSFCLIRQSWSLQVIFIGYYLWWTLGNDQRT
ncbi:hypothetical protein FACUT_437 [Fusarium acutatum]|uniref:Uncharacterized protein n=1 Tax=Fusarium acutatum TaxID=78861 RepID=A0A8H4P155_9HYPO|nr:hypothetical protein FACUT_437 [Fusarium acutatum]